MVDVEECALRALEQQRIAPLACLLQQCGDIRHHRTQRIGEGQRVVARLRERHRRGVKILFEHEIVELEDLAQLRCETIGVEKILETDRAARDLVLVRRADAAAGRADFRFAHGALARLIERHVIGKHQGQAGEILRRERTSTPAPSSSPISCSSAVGESTTPLPM